MSDQDDKALTVDAFTSAQWLQEFWLEFVQCLCSTSEFIVVLHLSQCSFGQAGLVGLCFVPSIGVMGYILLEGLER